MCADVVYDEIVSETYNSDRECETHWVRENEFIEKFFKGRMSGSVLDVPVGTGRFIGFYPNGMSVIGIDISEHMLNQARRALTELNRNQVLLRVGDAVSLDFIQDNSIDFVVCFRLLHLIDDDMRLLVLKEMARVVKGDVVLQVYLTSNVRSSGFSVIRNIIGTVRQFLFRKRTPWSHIKSYPTLESNLFALFAAAGLAVESRHDLCRYEGAEVCVFVLKRN